MASASSTCSESSPLLGAITTFTRRETSSSSVTSRIRIAAELASKSPVHPELEPCVKPRIRPPPFPSQPLGDELEARILAIVAAVRVNLHLIASRQIEELRAPAITTDDRHGDLVRFGPDESVRWERDDILAFPCGFFDREDVSFGDDSAVMLDQRKCVGTISECHFSFFLFVAFQICLGTTE